jgi:exonuclease III
MGGDWNATYSTDPSADNIDIFRMARPPSIYRSEGISDLCTTYNLSDPFRILYPDTRDYTFRPRTGRLNRSRLDFFLISNNLIDCLSTCDIKLALCTELFDHKSVSTTS